MKTEKQIMRKIESMTQALTEHEQRHKKAGRFDCASGCQDQILVLLELQKWILTHES